MSEELSRLRSELDKSRREFDVAATCLVQALEAFNQRMERVEQWIVESQKNRPAS